MKILKTYARLWVDDLESAIPLYEAIVGEPAHVRLKFEQAELGGVGDFLLIGGPREATDAYRGTIGPVVVDDLDAAEEELTALGAARIGDRLVAPTGRLMYARHPDGVQVEFLPELVERIIGRPAAERVS